MSYKLNKEAAAKLRSLVEDAMTAVHEPLEGTEKLISDIYTGRDPLGGSSRLILGDQGIPLDEVVDPNSSRVWRPPETTANLFLSRLRQIVTALTPGTPTFEAMPRVPGAARMAEFQNEIMEWVSDHGDLETAMRRSAFLGLLSPYFGIKLVVDKNAELDKKAKFISVEPGDCGYEPFHRRFNWHSYQMQWADLPTKWRPKLSTESVPNDWDIVQVTEVYHEGFRFGSPKMSKKGCPMSIFVEVPSTSNPTDQVSITARAKKNPGIGNYTYSFDVPECPIQIASFLDPAPKEDVAPAEVLSWIPLMRMIVQVLIQINREITTTNSVVLYDKSAISDDVISVVQSASPGSTIFAPVDVDDAARGVNATMRPVEQDSVLGEYLAALQNYMALFDDVTGVGPLDRGAPANPRKSATEASSIVAASNRRNRDRLEIMANLWSDMARVFHAYQQDIYGSEVTLPLANGLSRTLPVPDPEVAAFGFRVDAIELGHLSRRGDVDTYFNWLQTTTNVLSTFQGSLPRMVREALRRMGKAMGVADVDLYLDAPVIEQGPEDRYIEHLQLGTPLPAYPEDQHQLYVAYYGRILERALATGNAGASPVALQDVIDKHNLFIRQAAASAIRPQGGGGGGVVPGMNEQGQADNQIAADLAAGLAPGATEQTLG